MFSRTAIPKGVQVFPSLLIGRFGYLCPATGFSFDLERVIAALEARRASPWLPCCAIAESPSRGTSSSASWAAGTVLIRDVQTETRRALPLDVFERAVAQGDAPWIT